MMCWVANINSTGNPDIKDYRDIKMCMSVIYMFEKSDNIHHRGDIKYIS